MPRLHLIMTICLSIPLYIVLFLPSPYYNQLAIQGYLYLYCTIILTFLAGAQWSFACEYKLKSLLFSSLILFVISFLMYAGLVAGRWPPFTVALSYMALTTFAALTNYLYHKRVSQIFHRVYHWKSIILFIGMLANFLHLIVAYD